MPPPPNSPPHPPLLASLLLISDTLSASSPSSPDLTTPLLTRILHDHHWTLTSPTPRIVPDDLPLIQRAVTEICDGAAESGATEGGAVEGGAVESGAVKSSESGAAKSDNDNERTNLLLTSGGTGFGVRDVTPEAVRPLIEKEAGGIVHGMLAASLEKTPFAIMSRPVAGIRGKTLIITLPGSPKAAQENLLAIIKQLPHACVQAAGADSRALHAQGIRKLEEDAGFHASKEHHHSHHSHGHAHPLCGHVVPKARSTNAGLKSNNPLSGPARRHRESPYPMLSVEEATQLVLEQTPRPKVVKAAVDSSLVEYVLAENVIANEAVPAYRASIVDGYAIIVPKGGPSPVGTFEVAAVSHAAPGEVLALRAGQVARVTTGAPLPPNATSVVMVEDTVLISMDGKEEKEIEILTDEIEPNENVRAAGSDIQAGETILKEGDQVSAVGGELGLLASVGKAEVSVYQKPIVGVLSTGDEIVEHDRPGGLRIGEVRDCNRTTVMAVVQGWGFDVVDLGIAKDKPGTLESYLREAIQEVDIIVTTGGVSMGELDLLKPTIERSLGGTIHFGRVAMKPGKPTTFATIPFDNKHGTHGTRLIFSLPGNPASALVTLHLFVLPCLHHWSGIRPPGLPKVLVTLGHDIRLDAQRSEFHRAIISAGKDGLLHAASTGGQRSSRVGSLRSAIALLCLPVREGSLRKGEKVEALIMGKLIGL